MDDAATQALLAAAEAKNLKWRILELDPKIALAHLHFCLFGGPKRRRVELVAERVGNLPELGRYRETVEPTQAKHAMYDLMLALSRLQNEGAPGAGQVWGTVREMQYALREFCNGRLDHIAPNLWSRADARSQVQHLDELLAESGGLASFLEQLADPGVAPPVSDEQRQAEIDALNVDMAKYALAAARASLED